MEFLVNDLSVAGQFSDTSAFRDAINRVLSMQNIARQFGRDLFCHRNLANAQVTPYLSMPQAIQSLNRNEQRSFMQWLTRNGPFWEDTRIHGPGDFLECNGDVVTDTAVGEAAFCCFHGIDRRLVSLTPSDWEFSPIPVIWKFNADTDHHIEVDNYWEPMEFEAILRAAPVPVETWEQLESVCKERCPHLTFSADSFETLRGHPFSDGAAKRILFLLDKLEEFKCCFDDEGNRTPRGNEIFQTYFTGQEAPFTPSSDTEVKQFRKELTFRHPTVDGEVLFCSWHGKVQTPQLRIHFSWPVHADEPLYVVYVGPKITKR